MRTHTILLFRLTMYQVPAASYLPLLSICPLRQKSLIPLERISGFMQISSIYLTNNTQRQTKQKKFLDK